MKRPKQKDYAGYLLSSTRYNVALDEYISHLKRKVKKLMRKVKDERIIIGERGREIVVIRKGAPITFDKRPGSIATCALKDVKDGAFIHSVTINYKEL